MNSYNNSFDNSDLRDMFDNIDFDNLDEDSNEGIKVNKKQSQNKNNMCSNCNSNENIIEDFSLGIVVCKNCGQVLDSIIDANPEWRSFEDDNNVDLVYLNFYHNLL